MSDAVRIYHAGNQVEADMMLERLKQYGIMGYAQNCTPNVRPGIFYGDLGALHGVDVYVSAGNAPDASRLLNEWEEIIPEDMDAQYDQPEIAEDVQEYLEEQAEDKRRKQGKKETSGGLFSWMSKK